MAESQIEWTDATWNPVAGCTIVSAGCTHCYAMNMARRLEAMGVEKYFALTRKSCRRTIWTGKVRQDEASLQVPYGWKKPRKVFVNSMSDLFHEGVKDSFIDQVWRVMEETPRHQYQILTKRPERMLVYVNERYGAAPPNVWLGTSVENKEAKDRILQLQKTRAAIRFISFEPLIGSVGLLKLRGIDWAIVGGESGAQARPVKEEWITEIHKQCKKSNTAFFSSSGAPGEKTIKSVRKKQMAENISGEHGMKCLLLLYK